VRLRVEWDRNQTVRQFRADKEVVMVIRGQTPTDQGVAKPINLIEECPEVTHWAEGVINSMDSYKLFPDENFASLLVGVMSSTSTDKQGESFELEDLERTVARVEQSAFWSVESTIRSFNQSVARWWRNYFSKRTPTCILSQA
jgi:hypothetical protein